MKVDAGLVWRQMDAIDIRLIQRIPTVPFNWYVRSEDESSESDFIRSTEGKKVI